jgi:hypothetical protein
LRHVLQGRALNCQKYPPKSPDQVKLYVGDQKPDCDFEIVGQLSGDSDTVTATDPEKVLRGVREAVAEFGGDGAMHMQKAAPGNVGGDHGQTTADVFICKGPAKTAATSP